jgi:hypothetical protein
MREEKQPRPLKKLIKDFEASIGDFDKFRHGMSAREFVMFKGWLQSMRAEIPKFAGQDHPKFSLFETTEEN